MLDRAILAHARSALVTKESPPPTSLMWLLIYHDLLMI
jgi:hypothetical protein